MFCTGVGINIESGLFFQIRKKRIEKWFTFRNNLLNFWKRKLYRKRLRLSPKFNFFRISNGQVFFHRYESTYRCDGGPFSSGPGFTFNRLLPYSLELDIYTNTASNSNMWASFFTLEVYWLWSDFFGQVLS